MSIFLSLPAFILAIIAGIRMNKNHKAHRHLSRELYDGNFNYSPSLELSTTRSDLPVSRIIFPERYHVGQQESSLSVSSRVILDEPPSPASSSDFGASLCAADPGTNLEDVGNVTENVGCESESEAPSSVVFNRSHLATPELEPELRDANTSRTIIRTHSKSKFFYTFTDHLRSQACAISESSRNATNFRRGLFYDIWRLLLFQM